MKKTSKNNDLLYIAKEKTSPKLYSIMVELVNEGKEKLVKDIMKVDYLLEYTSTCIKHRDFKEAKETAINIKSRIDKLYENGVNVEYLEYLYNGIKNKIK